MRVYCALWTVHCACIILVQYICIYILLYYSTRIYLLYFELVPTAKQRTCKTNKLMCQFEKERYIILYPEATTSATTLLWYGAFNTFNTFAFSNATVSNYYNYSFSSPLGTFSSSVANLRNCPMPANQRLAIARGCIWPFRLLSFPTLQELQHQN